VIFDKGNWLVADVEIARPLDEVLFQLENGDLAARLQAARQLATAFPRRLESMDALASLLADTQAHWGLRQEAALDLGTIGGAAATEALGIALKDEDRRLRRAAAIALGEAGSDVAAELLRTAVQTDTAEEVVGVAAFALGRMHAPGAGAFLQAQLSRKSPWGNVITIGALLGLAELRDSSFAPIFNSFTGSEHSIQARLAALEGWVRAAPEDPALAQRLREMAYDSSLTVRGDAIDKLGQLHRGEDVDFLETLAVADPDPNLARTARDAAELIQKFDGSVE
jgi:HEAT repeat protein